MNPAVLAPFLQQLSQKVSPMSVPGIGGGRFNLPVSYNGPSPDSGSVGYIPHPQQAQYEDEASKIEEKIAKLEAQREEKRRAASTFKPPQQDPSMGIRPGAAGAAILAALLLNTLEKNAGTKGLEGFLGGAQAASGMRYQNQVNEFNVNRQNADLEADILGDQINRLDKQHGYAREESRFNRSEADRIRREEAAQKKFEDQQNEIRGRQLRSQFGAANSVAELQDLMEQFSDPSIAKYAPNPKFIENKMAEVRKKESDDALKVQNATKKEEVDNYEIGYRAAYDSAQRSLQGWTKDLERQWQTRRAALKGKHGLKDVDLSPVARAGAATAISKASYDERVKSGEFYRDLATKRYELANQKTLDKINAGEKISPNEERLLLQEIIKISKETLNTVGVFQDPMVRVNAREDLENAQKRLREMGRTLTGRKPTGSTPPNRSIDTSGGAGALGGGGTIWTPRKK